MESQDSSRGGGGIAGVLAAVVASVAAVVSSAWNAVTKDGALAAAGRQGADELGIGAQSIPGIHPCGRTGNDP